MRYKALKILLFFCLFYLNCSSKKVLYNGTIYTKLPNGLMYRDLEIGKVSQKRGLPIISYTIYSHKRKQLYKKDLWYFYTSGLEYRKGQGNSILILGLKGMNAGGIRELIISPRLRIGQTWIPFSIKSENELILIIKLIGYYKR